MLEIRATDTGRYTGNPSTQTRVTLMFSLESPVSFRCRKSRHALTRVKSRPAIGRQRRRASRSRCLQA